MERIQVHITVSLTVDINEKLTTLADFIENVEWDFYSQTEGADIIGMDWVDFEEK